MRTVNIDSLEIHPGRLDNKELSHPARAQPCNPFKTDPRAADGNYARLTYRRNLNFNVGTSCPTTLAVFVLDVVRNSCTDLFYPQSYYNVVKKQNFVRERRKNEAWTVRKFGWNFAVFWTCLMSDSGGNLSTEYWCGTCSVKNDL